MKKQYITPAIRIQEMEAEALMGEFSGGLKGAAPNAALSKENEADWENGEE